MKKHIVFDFDDTMTSGYELNQQLFLDTFLPYKPDIDEDYVRNLHLAKRGISMVLLFEEVRSKFNLQVTVEQLVEENELLHQARAGEMKVFEGVEDALKHFRKLGKVISLCTNRARASLDIILTKNNLHQYFDNIISCADAGHEKPDPYCFVELMGKYPDISKEETIYFGDSKTDAQFAINAGVEHLVIDHYLNNKLFYLMALQSFAGLEDELLVEVDEDNKEIGAIYKVVAHLSPSRFHRSVSIVVFTSEGKIILQKRSMLKAVDPGKWDLTGGHQAFGQTIEQTATSELMEELGIRSELSFVRTGLKQDAKQREFYNLYYTVHDGPYKFAEHEVAEIKEFDCQKLIDHEYDADHQFLDYVYERVTELKPVWENLKSNVSL